MTLYKHYLCSLIHKKNRDDKRHIYLMGDKLEVVTNNFSVRKIIQGIKIKDTEDGKIIESSFQLNNSYHYLPDKKYVNMFDIIDAIKIRDCVISNVSVDVSISIKQKLNLDKLNLDDFDIIDINQCNDFIPRTIVMKHLESFMVR